MEVRRLRNDELYHHGIKGQKWGIRRYQNADGTLTAEGRKRYGTVENFNKSRDRSLKALTAAQIANAGINVYRLSKAKDKSDKIAYGVGTAVAGAALGAMAGKKAYNIVKKKKTEGKKEKEGPYQNPDGSLTEAGKERYGTIENIEKDKKRKKIAAGVAITAGVTLAAAGAYIAHDRYVKENVDKVIYNKEFYRSAVDYADGRKKKMGRMYVTDNVFDKKLYQDWIFGKAKASGEKAATYTYKVDKFKVASNKTARKHFEELYNNDSEFKKAVDRQISNYRIQNYFHPIFTRGQKKAFDKAVDKKDNKSLYEVFNYLAANSGDENLKKNYQKFYDSLKKSGFDAINDVNDNKLSGFKSPGAKIVFNTDVLTQTGKEAFDNFGDKKALKIQGQALAIALGRSSSNYALGALAGATVAGTIGATAKYDYKKNRL